MRFHCWCSFNEFRQAGFALQSQLHTRKQMAAMQQGLNRANARLSELRDRLEQSQAQAVEFKTRLDQEKTLNAELRSKADQAKTRIAFLQNIATTFDARSEAVQAKLDETSFAVRQLRLGLKAAEAQAASLQASLDRANNQIAAFQAEKAAQEPKKTPPAAAKSGW